MADTEKNYRLAIDGDDFEQHCWNLFVKDQFPSYESFWLKSVVPLTNRPNNIHFKTNVELVAISKSESDLCVAQLNYSILRHLMRCFKTLKILETPSGVDQQLDLLQEGMARLVGAQDNAFELLERVKNPSKYKAFKDNSGAREKWKKNNNEPLQHIRKYRNSLLHGRLLPGIMDGVRLCLPSIGKESLYLDWRIITDLSNNPSREKAKEDFFSVLNILESAWKETIVYLENHWKSL